MWIVEMDFQLPILVHLNVIFTNLKMMHVLLIFMMNGVLLWK